MSRLLNYESFPLSASAAQRLRSEAKKSLGFSANASEKKLADAYGVSVKEMYHILVDAHNEYVDTHNAQIEEARLAARREKARIARQQKKEGHISLTQLDEKLITKQMEKKYWTKPFKFTMKSSLLPDVKRSFDFKNIHNFRNWIKGLREARLRVFDSTNWVYEYEIDDFRHVFEHFSYELTPLGGGRDNSRTMKRNFKLTNFDLEVLDPKSKNNNCGIKVVEAALGIELDTIDVRKRLGVDAGKMLTCEQVIELHGFYSEKSVAVISDDFDGEVNSDETTILLHNEHYYLVVAAVKKSFKNKTTKRGYLYWDIETRQTKSFIMIGQKKSYILKEAILSIVYKPYKATEYSKQTFVTDDEKSCVEKFKDFLSLCAKNGKFFHCIAHNASRFDHYLLFSKFSENDVFESNIQLRGTAIIGLQYKSHLFKDSCCFLTNSLKNLCKGYLVTDEEKQYAKIENLSLHGEVISNTELCFYKPDLDFGEFLQLEKSDPEFWEQYVKYCEYDCFALAHVWEKFMSQMKLCISKMGNFVTARVSVMSVNTIGSLAKKCIEVCNGCADGLKASTYMTDYKRFIGSDFEKYEFIKNFKRGGISHCNQPGKHTEGVCGFDIKSQYPTAMMNMQIPVGNSWWTDEERPEKFGFYHLKDVVFFGRKFKPVALKNSSNILEWDQNEIAELFVDTFMLDYLKKNCDLQSYTVVRGLVSNRFVTGEQLFGKYVGSLYEEKALQDELKEKKDPAYNQPYREVIKLMLNSLSGKLVEDPSRYFRLKKIECEDDAAPRGDVGLNQVQFQKDGSDTAEKINYWVTAGVMVYSYSKRLLFEYINCLPNKSDDVIHIETDGIYFPKPCRDEFVKNVAEYSGEYKEVALGDKLGNVDEEVNYAGTSYWLGKKFYYIYTKYNSDGSINYPSSKIRIKGIPCTTIDKAGKTRDLVDESFYERIYKGESVKTDYSAISRFLFGNQKSCDVKLTGYTATRTTRGMMSYREY